MASEAPITRLPAEVLLNIISHANPPSYVEAHLEDVPSQCYDSSGNQIASDASCGVVKNMSLVCRSWREACFPFLFSHLRIRATLPWRKEEAETAELSRGSNPIEALKDFFKFLEDSRGFLERKVQTVTVFASVPRELEEFFEELVAKEKESHDNPKDLQMGISGKVMRITMPDVMRKIEADRFSRGMDVDSSTDPHAENYRDADDVFPVIKLDDDPFPLLWEAIQTLNPRRVSLIGTGSILGGLLIGSASSSVTDVALRHRQLRMVSFGREVPPQRPETEQVTSNNDRKTPVGMFKWASLLIHEGQGFESYRYGMPSTVFPPIFVESDYDVETRFMMFGRKSVIDIPFVSYISPGKLHEADHIKHLLSFLHVVPKTLRYRCLPPDYDHKLFLQTAEAGTIDDLEAYEREWAHRFSDESQFLDTWGGLLRLAASRNRPEVIELPDLDRPSNPKLWDKWVETMISPTWTNMRAYGRGRVRLLGNGEN